MGTVIKFGDSMNEHEIKEWIENAKVIAVVGHSANPERTSYKIANYLRKAGYHVMPVNPSVETINEEKSYNSLKDINEKIDIVQVFRRPEYLAAIVEEAIEVKAGGVWGQFGVIDSEAEKIADEAGMRIVMDKCLKVEHRRLT